MADVIDQQYTGGTDSTSIGSGNIVGTEYRTCQSFKLSKTATVTKVEIEFTAGSGSPSGTSYIKIETDSSSQPSGTLANANATSEAITVTANTWNTFTFATPFQLTGGTTYWIRYYCNNQSLNVYWTNKAKNPGGYTDGSYGQFAGASWESLSNTWDMNFKVYILVLAGGFLLNTY